MMKIHQFLTKLGFVSRKYHLDELRKLELAYEMANNRWREAERKISAGYDELEQKAAWLRSELDRVSQQIVVLGMEKQKLEAGSVQKDTLIAAFERRVANLNAEYHGKYYDRTPEQIKYQELPEYEAWKRKFDGQYGP